MIKDRKGVETCSRYVAHEGIPLREWEDFARHAYEAADAMLKVREE